MCKNPPIETLRYGRVHLNVWENEHERQLADGSTVTRKIQSVSVARTIVNKDGQFQDVNNYSFTDLLSLREVIDDVIAWKKNQQQTVDQSSNEEEPLDEELDQAT